MGREGENGWGNCLASQKSLPHSWESTKVASPTRSRNPFQGGRNGIGIKLKRINREGVKRTRG